VLLYIDEMYILLGYFQRNIFFCELRECMISKPLMEILCCPSNGSALDIIGSLCR